MADENEANPVAELLRKRGNAMTHTVSILMLSSLLGVNFYGDELGLATRAYVNERVADNTEKLDRILELQTAEQIDKLLRWKCMNQGDTSLDDTLRGLESDYREITGDRYQRPPCGFLLDSRQ